MRVHQNLTHHLLMRGNIAIILFLSLISLSSFGQDVTGDWNGLLKFQGVQLRIVFNIQSDGQGYKATMDSPDQGAKGIPVTTASYKDSILTLAIQSAKLEYSGTLTSAGVINGTFKQGGVSIPLDLTRSKIDKEVARRPQEPTKPYPYVSEEVTFTNERHKVTLAGTLSYPSGPGPFPAIVLISGSGPQNRDEEILGHKPFLVIADHLTRNGFAVLRYDDRGTGKSDGNFANSTSEDFSWDAEAAVSFLKLRPEVLKQNIGLMGHSEGGIIAPMVAARSTDVAFIVLLAGTGIPGDQLLLMQQELIGRVSGASKEDLEEIHKINKGAFDIVNASKNDNQLVKDLESYMKKQIKASPGEVPEGVSEKEFIDEQIRQLTSPWMKFFLRHDPAPVLEKVKCPVLAVNGNKDLQVPCEVNLRLIESSCKRGGNTMITTKQFDNLNHLFQHCKTGSPDEYSAIEETFSPEVLLFISNWLTVTTRR